MRGIIIGGGIGGLCVANSLQRVGIDVRVYELAPALEPVGAGIIMAPNAMWVFQTLRMAAAIEERGVCLERLGIADWRGHTLQTMDCRTMERAFGNPIVAIHRAELHQILFEHLEGDVVRLGRRCVQCSQTRDEVVATFEDGSQATGDFLIGADGLRSAVRNTLFPKARLRYTGQTCWRGVLNTALPDGPVDSEWWGRGVRVGFLPIGQGQVYWYAAANREAGGVDDTDPRPRLLEVFGGFAEPVPSMMAQTTPGAIIRHDLYDLHPMASWSIGRITLLGDAAHAPTPNLGQGGAQAVEDAWVLADELATTGAPAIAFERYERRRLPKANKIIRESRRVGWIGGLKQPALCALRNLLVRWTPQAATRRHVAWVLKPPH